MYHTLLNYKLRLLLKVREWLLAHHKKCLSTNNKNSATTTSTTSNNSISSPPTSTSTSTSFDEIDPYIIAKRLSADNKFVQQEANRFEQLIDNAGMKWGAKESHSNKNVLKVSLMVYIGCLFYNIVLNI